MKWGDGDMAEMFVEIGMAVFAVLYIFGYVHDFIFWLCDRHKESNECETFTLTEEQREDLHRRYSKEHKDE